MQVIDLPSNIQHKAAVHWICISCSAEIARIILAKGIDVNRLDNDGHMGPFYMLDVGEDDETIEILELLLKHGLDVNKKTPNTSSILGEFVSSITKPKKIIEWLLAHGADMYSTLAAGKTVYDFLKQTPDLFPIAKRYLEKQNNTIKVI